MERYEALVIGLGAMGAATVYQLAKAGAKVAGIDRHHPPHTLGSSHGDTRITRLSVGEGAQYVPIVRRSHRIWRELETLSGEALFEQSGLLVLTSHADFDPSDANDFTLRTLGLAQTYGIAHEVLDATQIRQRFPQFAQVTDNAIGYYEPEGGFVRPERCIDVQLRLAEQHGATLYKGETVTDIRSDAHGVTVTTDQRTLQADKLVVSAGNWAGGLLGAPFDRLLSVYRQQLFWFATEPDAQLVGASPTFILTHGQDQTNYGFPALPGEGSLKVATAQYHTASTPETLDRSVSPAQAREMYEQQVQGRIAGLTAEVVKAAVCAYTVTPDHHFIIDAHPTLQHTLVVSPCSGHGFKHSAALGEAFAQWCMRGESELDLSSFSLQRFDDQ
ncbi:N-methyl-L-tryptophan oxidase [Pseudomonas sp. FP453]|uniref:N-methyl-L-tryptophan oxidase n=1 Tax=unclassified Pseudomonas TaxID=196821 RepID=UPI00034C5C59|nr:MULTISPECIES: N-methyl-L-tryptophan oxidase [unclassified Pseudomonas]WLH88693.1 N-methyl-L-tryptophan oxidase [Pseudomonas sp. FP453]